VSASSSTTPAPKDALTFDVVAASLVVNFMGHLEDRASFLFRVWHFLRPLGLFYLVLPAPCVLNSRYLTHERLVTFLRDTCALELVEHHFSPRLAFYLCQRRGSSPPVRAPFRKVECNPGAKRNNFAIVLSGDGD
jgi:25S rRNA (adenine2142-N1)-methyltransferase